jgi:hypothetical protein
MNITRRSSASVLLCMVLSIGQDSCVLAPEVKVPKECEYVVEYNPRTGECVETQE